MQPKALRRILPALLAVLALALAACGDDEPASDTADPAAEPETVEVVLRDYEFVGVPERVAPGTQFTVVNESEAELHELVAFRLPDDEERSVEELSQLPPDQLGPMLGEPATVLLAPPDGEMIPAVGDGTLTEPGRYALMCFIPTGIEPQEYLDAAAETEEGPPQVEGGGPPHVVHGMVAEVTVS